MTSQTRTRLGAWILGAAALAALSTPAFAELSSTPAWERQAASGQNLGSAVSTAGDFDCDGIADLALANPRATVKPDGTPGWTNGGWVGVWFGGTPLPPQPNAVPDWWVYGLIGVPGGGVGVQTGFGGSVAAGDVNGDRCDDLIVGAPNFFASLEGVAVYLGHPGGPSTSVDWFASAAPLGTSRFGDSIATGDVNGDGFADIVVGAPDASTDPSHLARGVVAVFLGAANIDTRPDGSFATADWTAEGDQDVALLGESVASPGDVDGDGDDEVLAGAPFFDNGQADEGIAVMWRGQPGFESTADGTYANASWRHEVNAADAHLGQAVAGAGDVDGDGFADLLIGAPNFDDPSVTGINNGLVVVRRGAPGGPPSNVASWIHVGDADHSFMGFTVATAGDMNGDGLADYLIGELGFDDVHLWLGRKSWPGSPPPPDLTYDGGSGAYPFTNGFGAAISSAGDWNGDGFTDAVIGARTSSNSRAFVFLGSGQTLELDPSTTMTISQPEAGLGLGMGFAGDINHDGCTDFIAGAPYYESAPAQEDEGRIFVGYGTEPPCQAFNEILLPGQREGEQPGAQLGFSASGAGDVNGDGYADVVAGAPLFDESVFCAPPFTFCPVPDAGRANVYYGGPSGLSTSPNAATSGLVEGGAQFGYAAASAGDVNGDGYGDVVVGAPYAAPGGLANAGRAFLYLGSASGLTLTHSWSAAGTQAGAHFGIAVAGAGDVNGDGYSDVIIGADGHGGTGAVFVYLGQPTQPSNPRGLSTTPVRVFTGTPGSALGTSVASAGDLNRDGYSDMVAGAPSADVGYFPLFGGEVRIYYGGSPPTTGANVVLVGDPPELDHTRFGSGVSAAGDVNGDGYGDLIVGDQWHFGAAGFAQGKAYLFHGSASGIVVAAARTFEDCPTSFCDFGRNVSGEGDLNGDGFADVLIGAFKFTDTASFQGAVFAHLGGGGRGVPLRPLQDAGFITTTPLALLGAVPGTFTASIDTPSPAGRTDVSVEFENKPLGVDFDGLIGSILPTNYTDNVTQTRLAAGYSTFAGAKNTWRARLRSVSPLFGRSRWVSLPGNAPRELDVRVVPEPGFALGLASGVGGLAWLARRRVRRAAGRSRP